METLINNLFIKERVHCISTDDLCQIELEIPFFSTIQQNISENEYSHAIPGKTHLIFIPEKSFVCPTMLHTEKRIRMNKEEAYLRTYTCICPHNMHILEIRVYIMSMCSLLIYLSCTIHVCNTNQKTIRPHPH